MSKSVAADIARITETPAGLIIAGTIAVVVGVVLIKNIASALFGQNGSFNPETNATDAQGNPVPAYGQVGGVLGWAGAAANAGSGGLLSSFGEWIGGKVADLTCTYDPNAPPVAIGCSVASTDPVSGIVFEDRFRKASTNVHSGSIPTSNQFRERSGAIQSWSARPHQQGNNAAYHDAYDNSPPDPLYTASILVTGNAGKTVN